MKFAPALLLLASVAQAAAGESQPVLLDFHADWCGPCRQMRPAVQALVDKGYPVKSIDIDKSPKLAEKYDVQAVPTFIVADENGEELDRSSGAQPAGQLAKFYLKARDQAAARQSDRGASDDEEGEEPADVAESVPADELTEQEAADRKARNRSINPKPWETVVRIKVYNGNSVGFGSGTIIHSTPEQSLILTCAHIFKTDGGKNYPPSKFPNKITIDLFDGKLKGPGGQQLTCIEEGIPGKAVDYDFGTDVGLIVFKPGRRLPASRVVPPHFEPKQRMHMYTVGCSEGRDATAWDTVITRPPTRLLKGNDEHLAIECAKAPKQGRSGGGLYTDNGFLAGVCNFAEPQGDRGLYAAPESIYRLLDRNKLATLYAPPSLDGSGTLLADNGRAGRSVRGQSPDREDRPRTVRAGEVSIPEPPTVGITLEPLSPADSRRQVQSASNRGRGDHVAWAAPRSSRPADPIDEKVAEPTDLDLDREADGSHFAPPAYDDEEGESSQVNDEDVAPRVAPRKPAASGNSSGWRPSGSAR